MDELENKEKYDLEEELPNSVQHAKRKVPLFFRILLSVFFVPVFIIAAWFAFSFFNRTNDLNLYPKSFDVFVHAESVYDSLNPLLDLKSCDILFAEKQFSQFRKAFMDIKSSDLRNNGAVKFVLRRKVNFALYGSEDNPSQFDYMATLDLSYLSALSRLYRIVFPFLGVKEMSLVEESSSVRSYLKFSDGVNDIFIKPHKNVVLVTNSKTLLEKAFSSVNENEYSREDESTLTDSSRGDIHICVNSRNFIKKNTEKDEFLRNLHTLIPAEKYTSLDFSINDSEINLKADVPVDVAGSSFEAKKVLEKYSEVPVIVQKLPSKTQYYTVLDFGPFWELRDNAFPLLEKDKKMLDSWKKADSLCKTFFSLSLDDLVFSWTKNECAVFGIEGSSDPVFALQISDEKKRAEVFDILESSILINNNTSLILNGTRLPCLELPSFLTGLLSCFGVNLPSAYYFINDSFIYFSISPQNLSVLNSEIKDKKFLVNNESWKSASKKGHSKSSVNMYYDLERSVPFFINSKTIAGKILNLYNIGNMTLNVDKGCLKISLHAVVIENKNTKIIPGFPISLEGKTDYALSISSDRKTVFWIENSVKVCSLELDSLEKHELEISDGCSMCVSDEKGEYCLWVLSKSGTAYLLNGKLECRKNFPVITNMQPSCDCAVSRGTAYFATNDGKIISVGKNGEFKDLCTIDDVKIKSRPSVCGDTVYFYSRGFEGLVYAFKNGEFMNLENPMIIDGIGFGSPCCVSHDSKTYTAFMTQSGLFFLYADNEIVENFPLQLDDTFHTNAVFKDGAFFVLSDSAVVYKIMTDGAFFGVKIPDSSTAVSGFISVKNDSTYGGIYVCADKNILYGFDSSLELLGSFPVAGFGEPQFADVNGDRKIDCLTLSIDRKLNAWSLK